MSNNVRNEMSRLAQQIENLAQQVQSKIKSGADYNDLISTANELVRNNNVFVFTFGEMSALEEVAKTKKLKTTVVSNPANTKPRNYHNVRDALGRFIRV
jgi:hypothetical protein